jgi:hypothetical protein
MALGVTSSKKMEKIITITDNFNQIDRYNALMDVVRHRMTNRAFDPDDVGPCRNQKMPIRDRHF